MECIFTWNWLADLCAKEGIAFVLGHALYMRSIHGAKTKNDRAVGEGSAKIGNAYLKWAFSEAAVLFVAKCPQGKELLARFEKKHGKAKALSILAHRIGRAVYFMLSREKAFDLERFMRS